MLIKIKRNKDWKYSTGENGYFKKKVKEQHIKEI